jgi:hypothetical protein
MAKKTEPVKSWCGIPENMTADVIARSWRKRLIRWTVMSTVPGFDAEAMLQMGHTVYEATQAVCGMKFEYTDTARTADIRVYGKPYGDGPFGVLAYAELPNGSDGPLELVLDTAEPWENALQPGAHKNGAIPLFLTWLHEGGHNLGMGHVQSQRSVMYPQLNTSLAKWAWQDEDVKVLQSAYGLPTAPVPPPTDRLAVLEEAMRNIDAALAKVRR